MEAFDLPNECDLGYGDNELENRIVIYPNPSNGQINIKAFKDLGEDVQITIYDINGRIVHSQNVALHDRAQVNADSLRSGIYIIEIDAEKYTHTSKLVIR